MKLDHNMIGNGRLDNVLTLSEVSEHFESLNLSMSPDFFELFFERYLFKMEKKRSLKKNLALAHNSLKKKYKIPLCSKK